VRTRQRALGIQRLAEHRGAADQAEQSRVARAPHRYRAHDGRAEGGFHLSVHTGRLVDWGRLPCRGHVDRMSARTGVVGKFGKLINSVGACGAFGKSASLMNCDPESPACDRLLKDESGAPSSVFPIQTWQSIVH
jgi:hypothetical protein